MIVLGINDGHQSSAALMVDGRLVAAMAEERFTRRKNEHGYPRNAIQACLRHAGISPREISVATIATKDLPPAYFMIRRDSDFSIRDFWREQTEYWYPVLYQGKKLSYQEVFADKLKPENFPYDRSFLKGDGDIDGMRDARRAHTAAELGIPVDKVVFKDHHASHAYYGVLAAGKSQGKRLIFTADGFGDGANASIWIEHENGNLTEVARTNQCHIGRMYRYATLLLGMKPAEHEYKVMGLAPYANPDYCKSAYEVYAETLQVDGLGFNYKVRPKDNFFHYRDRLQSERFDAIAYAIQRRTEELLSEWVANAIAQTGIRDIVFSGGVAQNIKANKRIWEMPCVDSIFVPPGPHDESLSIGAACMETVEHGIAIPGDGFASAYLGTSYTDQEIDACLGRYRDNGLVVREAGPDEAADILAKGEVIGCFQGRMEFGARALGNRSILGDPRDPKVIQRINDQVKLRDFWMTFAPSIKEEREHDYMVNPKNIDARYMTMAFESTDVGKTSIPAALHPYDKTGRPNVVREMQNPKYHALISAFERLTGVGALLNTSFNLHGEPVVEKPEDALSTFERSGLSHIFIGGFLVSKKSEG
jgi:carbamoyltransferase